MAYDGGIPEVLNSKQTHSLSERIQEIAEIELALNQQNRSLLFHPYLQAATPAVAAPGIVATHKVPIILNGVTYQILLST